MSVVRDEHRWACSLTLYLLPVPIPTLHLFEKDCPMSLIRFVLTTLSTLLVGSAASADFTGITVSTAVGPSLTPLGATTIYRIWANFDASGGNVSSVNEFRIVSATGFTGFVHNDNLTAGAYSITQGSWAGALSNAAFGATDSWVSMLEPSAYPHFSAVPGAGWSNSDWIMNPQIPTILTSGVGWGPDPEGPRFPTAGQQLLGQFVVASTAELCMSATLSGFTTGFGTPTSHTGSGYYLTTVAFDFNGNCVPAPCALALLGFVGLAQSRRRSARC